MMRRKTTARVMTRMKDMILVNKMLHHISADSQSTKLELKSKDMTKSRLGYIAPDSTEELKIIQGVAVINSTAPQ